MNGGAAAQTITFGFPGTPPALVRTMTARRSRGASTTQRIKEIIVDTTTPAIADSAASPSPTFRMAPVWPGSRTATRSGRSPTTPPASPILSCLRQHAADRRRVRRQYRPRHRCRDDRRPRHDGDLAIDQRRRQRDPSAFRQHQHVRRWRRPRGGRGWRRGCGGRLHEGGLARAVDRRVAGLRIVDDANETLEIGFHVGYTMLDGRMTPVSATLTARCSWPATRSRC